MFFLLRFIAFLPLRLVHAIGAACGWLTYGLSPRYRRQLRANLAQAGLDAPAVRRRAIGEAGRQALETPWLWLRPAEDIAARVSDANPGELDRLIADPSPLLLLTPHTGSFEAFAQYYPTRPGAAQRPITVLYRMPRKAVLQPLMRLRGSHGVLLAPAEVRGVRMLARALKERHTAGILPDQVPCEGEGVWAPFFGRLAYTMTLPARLAGMTGARVVLVCCQRLPRGQYRVRYVDLSRLFTGNAEQDTAALNRELEGVIRSCPAQYLWGYNRYKTPAGVAPPQQGRPA